MLTAASLEEARPMKLYYYPVPNGNFGDYLNEVLWQHYLPEGFDEDARTLFVGIGTLLNDYVPAAERVIVFGAGVGYGKGLPNITDHWRIYCVRGPLSAEKLRLPASLALTDPAVLMPQVSPLPEKSRRYRFSYIPHVHCAEIGMESWREVCAELDFGLIDPRWPVARVLSSLAETECVIAEAMHGAILADAYGIPWIPVISNRMILPFKWQDWCASMGLTYSPHRLIGLWDPRPWSLRWLRHPYMALNPLRKPIVVQQLLDIAAQATPQLSSRNHLARCVERLEEKLVLVRANEFKQPAAWISPTPSPTAIQERFQEESQRLIPGFP
jgi:succinoglycan biosynthesis protein ExoV